MKLLGPLARFLKNALDTLLITSLVPVLAAAIVGLGLGWLGDGVAGFTGDVDGPTLWRRAAQVVGARPLTVRLVVHLPVQILVLAALWAPLRRAEGAVARLAARVAGYVQPLRGGRLALVGEGVGTLGLLIVLVPLVLQPTLVPLRSDRHTWLERAANLADGTAASVGLDAAVRLYGWWAARPVPGMFSVSRAELAERGLDGPLMARWDPVLRAVTRDREHFAQTKAFLWVESAGRQYAVSTTGCAGLMQFCVTTAQRAPFRDIFGRGQVSACDCGGRPCAVPPDLRDALETDSLALSRHPATFPCDPADARFDGRKALEAGAAYTTELGEAFGGNLYLMYIGYNSGPAVAKRLHERVGDDATLDDLRPHLAGVLARWYGDRAAGRAQGLLDVHLPKLRKAYEHYRR
ncbi:MAG: lytic transglycosylase domain-containing protein [Alphaproteobacteria bacterium]|nr:lytic transglycosylase domain-containing protein [Alphaproteobacteria bacterium]MCB9693237.1 lytic transglycosylase domain-containing protein [Alphaproteobacteria bacterium]